MTCWKYWYKVRDLRAEVLLQASEVLYRDEKEFYTVVSETEEVIIRMLEEFEPGRKLFTNGEFYTALVLHGCSSKYKPNKNKE